MTASIASSDRPATGPLLVVAGLLLGGMAWFLPVNLKSFSPALLQAAGQGTPLVAAFGRQWVEAEKIGPATLAREAARAVGDPGAAGLEAALQTLSASQPEMVAWGGWDPLLAPIGFTWQMAVALIPGMAAREVAVGALGTVYAVGGTAEAGTLASTLAHQWPLASALAFLAWYVFAPQCMSTLAVVRRETNSWLWPSVMFGYMLALAYVAAFGVYHVALAMGG